MRLSLEKFVSLYGQEAAADALCVSQGAISRALKAGREIYVKKTGGEYIAEEICRFPRKKAAAQEAA